MSKSEKNTKFDTYNEHTKVIGRRSGIVAVIILVMLLFGAGMIFYYYLSPVGGSTESVIVEIPKGATVSDVADILKENGLIRNAMFFRRYASLRCNDKHQIQAATYEFNPSMSGKEILDKMLKGDAYFNITVTEGMYLSEIAALLQKNHVCSAKDFIKECSNLKKYQAKYPILSSIPKNKGRNLEGYLYPATYFWGVKTDPETVVTDMIDCFVNAFSSEFQDQAKKMKRTVDEIIIVASIIEGEIKLEEDKANGASVLYNRMRDESYMPLQADSTINYALKSRGILSAEQLQIDSPYNTYVNYGLPAGPIGSPGMTSIKAALYPAKTEYLYFVSNMESGKTYFNETIKGHEADVKKHLK